MTYTATGMTQLKVRVPPEAAAAFKAECAAKGLSMTSAFSMLIEGAGSLRPTLADLSTRRQRRKEVSRLITELLRVRDAEAAYMERIPENLKGGQPYEDAEQSVSTMEEAIDLLTEAY
jgi:NAD(P)H-nitrite reductase large subunit